MTQPERSIMGPKGSLRFRAQMRRIRPLLCNLNLESWLLRSDALRFFDSHWRVFLCRDAVRFRGRRMLLLHHVLASSRRWRGDTHFAEEIDNLSRILQRVLRNFVKINRGDFRRRIAVAREIDRLESEFLEAKRNEEVYHQSSRWVVLQRESAFEDLGKSLIAAARNLANPMLRSLALHWIAVCRPSLSLEIVSSENILRAVDPARYQPVDLEEAERSIAAMIATLEFEKFNSGSELWNLAKSQCLDLLALQPRLNQSQAKISMDNFFGDLSASR